MTEFQELTESELDEVSGGNIALAVAGGILANAIYDAITGKDNGGFTGAVMDAYSHHQY